MAFLKLIDKECLPLMCFLCGFFPPWMLFDGVSLALSKSMVNDATVDKIHTNLTVEPGADVLKRKERLLVQNQNTRKLLAKFASGKPTPLTRAEFVKLRKSLHKECPSLYTLLEELHTVELARSDNQIYSYSFPGPWNAFLAILASPTSVVWIIRPKIIPYLLQLIQTKQFNANYHQVIYPFSPQLVSILWYYIEVKAGGPFKFFLIM